jgi:hypothetical protein
MRSCRGELARQEVPTPAGLQICGLLSERKDEMVGNLLENLFAGLRELVEAPAGCHRKAAQLLRISVHFAYNFVLFLYRLSRRVLGLAET